MAGPVYLLNWKAHLFSTRNDVHLKAQDAQDIIFLLDHIDRKGIEVTPSRCHWVVKRDFWSNFTSVYGKRDVLIRIGLPCEEPSVLPGYESSEGSRRSGSARGNQSDSAFESQPSGHSAHFYSVESEGSGQSRGAATRSTRMG